MVVIADEIRRRLVAESEEEYRKFSAALIPNVDNVLGVRLPALRKIAKEIAKSDYEKYFAYSAEFMEEKMLQGMLVGLVKIEPENKLKMIEKFVPRIDNWSVCDSFCCGLKFTKTNKEIVWKFLQRYLNSTQEFEVRFALVMMLNYFVEENYIDKIFESIKKFKHDGYYAKMGLAWLLSVCYVSFPKQTFEYMKNDVDDREVIQKAVRKICDSYRVCNEDKTGIKEFFGLNKKQPGV